MTDQQAVQLLRSLGVVRAFRDERESRLKVEVRRGAANDVLTVIQFKAEYVQSLRDLEESRQEILENNSAEPLQVEIAMGSARMMKMQVLKRDDQLTPDERMEKARRLTAVDAALRRHREIIAGLNYLQVHYKNLLALIAKPVFETPGVLEARESGARAVWLKGVKSAAVHCLNEAKKGGAAAPHMLELCRNFLARYVIAGEEEYTPEQLLNNVNQVRLLDR